MRIFSNGLPKNTMKLFETNIGIDDFFFYVGDKVTLEQALSVIALLSPDFFEEKGCIFWKNSVTEEYIERKKNIEGFFVNKNKKLERSYLKKDIERYSNNFSISDMFQKWEENKNSSLSNEEREIRYYKLLIIFAEQIKKYWRLALFECFPDKNFEFEVSGNGLLDEDGVCVTFWQV